MLHPPGLSVKLTKMSHHLRRSLTVKQLGIFRPQTTKLKFQFGSEDNAKSLTATNVGQFYMPSIMHNAQCKINHCKPNKIPEICKLKEGG